MKMMERSTMPRAMYEMVLQERRPRHRWIMRVKGGEEKNQNRANDRDAGS